MLAKVIIRDKGKIPLISKPQARFIIRGIYKSRIRKHSYLLYPNFDLFKSVVQLRHKLWIHSDESISDLDEIYAKLLNIKSTNGVHISVLHIPQPEVKPYLIITADTSQMENIPFLRIHILPTKNCPPHVFQAFKISLFVNNSPRIIMSLF